MRKYLEKYLIYIENRLKDCDNLNQEEIEDILREHMAKIQFMQHERLIHFLVTMLFAFMFFVSMGLFLITENIALLILMILLLSLIIPYIRHYYFLENNVQKMYYIYDDISDILKKSKIIKK